MKIDKVLMSCDDSHYQYFWPVVSTVCRKVLGITPVLIRIGDEDTDFYSDGYGLVKHIKKVDNIPTSTQAQFGRVFGVKYFPEEICLISDIDMMLLSKKYFVDDLKDFDDDSYIILSSDGYDKSRKECEGLFDSEVYPMCYHAAKGKLFREVMEIDDEFGDFMNKIVEFKVENEKDWFLDELYVSKMINSKIDIHNFIKLKRGYEENFLVKDRIEKYNFPVEYRVNEEMRLSNIRLGNYDVEKLKQGYYVDCHCVRPYGFYEKEIWDVANIVVNQSQSQKKDLIMITSYCDNKEKENVLRNLVNQIQPHKEFFDIMIVSHTSVPQDISELTNMTIFDKKNELLYDWDLRCKPWFSPGFGSPILSIYTGFYNTHLAIWRMIILGNIMAKNCGYKKVHHLEYDCHIENFDELYQNSFLLDIYDSITYNKKEDNVDDILFGTYQCYNIETLNNELLELNEERIKDIIRFSDTKSPEKMLLDLLHNNKKSIIKSEKLLNQNGNIFGLSHHDLNLGHTAWCLPYFDRKTGMLCFIVWNMEGKQTINVEVIYNEEKLFTFHNIGEGGWKIIELDVFENAKKLIVILNNKIRNTFDFTKNKEEFKLSSYRE